MRDPDTVWQQDQIGTLRDLCCLSTYKLDQSDVSISTSRCECWLCVVVAWLPSILRMQHVRQYCIADGKPPSCTGPTCSDWMKRVNEVCVSKGRSLTTWQQTLYVGCQPTYDPIYGCPVSFGACRSVVNFCREFWVEPPSFHYMLRILLKLPAGPAQTRKPPRRCARAG